MPGKKMIIIITRSSGDEYQKYWSCLDADQKMFSSNEGSVIPLNGKDYYLTGGSGWDFEKIKTMLKNDCNKAKELAVAIHDTYSSTKEKVEGILEEMRHVKNRLVYGYTGAGGPEFFTLFIKPLSRKNTLSADHFDRFWDYIWTNESYRNAVEFRSRTLLPFLALDLLKTAKSESIPNSVEMEILNCVDYYYIPFFNGIDSRQGRCEEQLDALKEVVMTEVRLKSLDHIDAVELKRKIEELVDCLSTQLTDFKDKTSMAAR